MNLNTDQRGTSNLVGFVMLFGVVAMLCGTLVAAYASELHRERGELQMALAGRELRGLQEGLACAAHANSSAPVTVEMGLGGDHRLSAWSPGFSPHYLRIGNASVTVYGAPLGAVEYRAPFARVVLEGGAVMRGDLRGEAAVLCPSWFMANGTLVVETWRLYGDDRPACRGGLAVLEGRHMTTRRLHAEWDHTAPLSIYVRTCCPEA